ncbi:hypothetical protein [Actinomyces sp. 565]|uniref:hypothetical protein n=1 Tax=Actinomyces sp. 565 TaxID=2057794 RepID=UPI0013A6C318|nr:hypothetical protein [Actinomyces sp. 565]NDR52722.1 hypothetical protein [Actinomyces sp. 565]
MTDLTSKVKELTEEQRSRKVPYYRLDTSKVTKQVLEHLNGEVQRAVRPLVDAMTASVQATGESVKQSVKDFEKRVSQVEAKRVEELAEDVKNADEWAERVISKVDRLSSVATWTAVGRFSIALLPLCVSIIIVGGLVWTITQFLGVAPVLAFLWSKFTAATAVWAKLLWAAAAVALVTLLCWLIWALLKWLDGEFRRW